jgi:ankyrin repeat protein
LDILVEHHFTILRELLAASQVRLTGSISAIMLVQAARSRKPDCLQVLLDSGFDVNSRDSGQGWTPLLSAVASDSFENVRILLSRGADANASDPNGRTPLWYAATTANTGTITLLTQHRADVNAQDNQGRTPLMHASDLCYTWNIHAFLNAGGNPTVTDKRGRTALQSESNTVGDPKCNEARQILREASNSWPTRPRQDPAGATFPKRRE